MQAVLSRESLAAMTYRTKSPLTITVTVEGIERDVSNLCRSRLPQRGVQRSKSVPSGRHRGKGVAPLYPSRHQVTKSATDLDIDAVFDSPFRKAASLSGPARGIERTKSLPLTGLSFNNDFPTRERTPHSVRRSLDIAYSSQSHSYQVTPPPRDTRKAPPSYSSDPRFKSDESPVICSSPLQHFQSPMHEEAATASTTTRHPRYNNSTASSRIKQPPKHQIEVSPGQFMTLRGAAETSKAIENGSSKTVFCFSCGAGLLCVPDCELVICPDCRIMSPVPQKEPALLEDQSCHGKGRGGGIPSIPSIWQDEEDEPATHVGGVGLGLKL